MAGLAPNKFLCGPKIVRDPRYVGLGGIKSATSIFSNTSHRRYIAEIIYAPRWMSRRNHACRRLHSAAKVADRRLSEATRGPTLRAIGDYVCRSSCNQRTPRQQSTRSNLWKPMTWRIRGWRLTRAFGQLIQPSGRRDLGLRVVGSPTLPTILNSLERLIEFSSCNWRAMSASIRSSNLIDRGSARRAALCRTRRRLSRAPR